LEKYFQIFTPKETKFSKPDERAFLAVLNFFKTKPEETLMVGDEIERDLIPAKKLGMETILIDRENKIKDAQFKKIGSLKELKNLIQ
jgi:putative hydrolase of the HAD superfamily